MSNRGRFNSGATTISIFFSLVMAPIMALSMMAILPATAQAADSAQAPSPDTRAPAPQPKPVPVATDNSTKPPQSTPAALQMPPVELPPWPEEIDPPARAIGPEEAGGLVEELRNEIVSERKASLKVYPGKDGARILKISESPVHFQDSSGRWQDIDNRIVDAGERLTNAAGRAEVSFGRTTADEHLRILSSGNEISMSLVDADASDAVAKGSTVTYPEVRPGVDLQYQVIGDSVKEVVVLNKAPESEEQSRFRFDLKTGQLEPKDVDGGGIDLVNAKGEPVFRIPPGLAWGTGPDGPSLPVAGVVDFELVKVEGGWAIDLIALPAWLAAATYPVFLDPTVRIEELGQNRGTAGHDVWVTSSDGDKRFESTPYNGYLVNFAGQSNNINYRTYAKFDIPYWHAWRIDRAFWFATGAAVAPNPASLRLQAIQGSWTPQAVSWNNQPALRPEQLFTSVYQNQWVAADIKAWAKKWFNGVWPNQGFMLDGNAPHHISVLTGQEDPGAAASFVYLELLPNQAPGDPVALSPDSPADGSTIESLTPTLQVAPATDPDEDPVVYAFYLSDGVDVLATSPGWIPETSWTVPEGVLEPGQTYVWHAYTGDGNIATSPDWTWSFKTEGLSIHTGLEDFWPYSSFDLGHGVAYPNMASGNLVVQDTDFEVPGRGLNLRLTRTYNSNQAGQAGPFGRGWTLGVAEGQGTGGLLQAAGTLNLGQVLTLLFGGDSAFKFIDADGTVHRFVKQGGVWQPPPGVNLTVEEGLLGFGYSLVRPDGVRYHFADAGGGGYNLARITDRAGNAQQFSFDGQSNLTEITDGAGRQLKFSYGAPNGQISRISFVAGAEQLHTDYAYGGANQDRLVSVTRAAGTSDAVVTEYGYSADGLSWVEDGRDNRTSFATPAGKLASITDRAGKDWQFDYAGEPGCSPATGAAQATCLTDPEGHTQVWSSNEHDNLVHRQDPGDQDSAGNPRLNAGQFAWSDNRLVSETDAAGNLVGYSYDAATGLIDSSTETGVDGTTRTSTFTVAHPAPGVGQITQAVIGSGSAEARIFDFAFDPTTGLLTSANSPEQTQPSLYSYHPGTSLLQSVTDAEGNQTGYDNYHASGQPGTITDAEGNPSVLQYDFLGRMTQHTDREEKLWKSQFDLRGNLVRTEDPKGSVATFCYDANNNQTVAAPPRATGAACSLDGTDGHSVKTLYDERDMVSQVVTKSDGKVSKSTYSYFDDGQLKSIKEPRSFDPADGSASGTDQSVEYHRYPNNRVSAFVDELGHVTDVVYTPHGLIEKVTDPPGDAGRHWITYAYNRLGQVTSVLESGHAQAGTFAYNRHGDLVAQTTPKGSTTAIAVDGMGRPSTVTDAKGNLTSYSYDQVGNLTALTQPTGNGDHITTSYAYTPLNQLDHESDPADAAHFIDYLYDKQGRQTHRHDRRDDPVTGTIERTVQRTFNADGTLAEQKATGTGLQEHRSVYGYDPDNNLASVKTYSAGSATPNISELAATWTSSGQLQSWSETIYPPGGGAPVTKSGSYDWAQDGLKSQSTIDGQSSSFSWLLNGLEDEFTPYGGFGSFSSTYFQNGALKQMSFPDSQVLTHGYDAADRLSDRVLAYSGVKLSAWEAIGYDEDNNRLSEQVTQLQPGGAQTGVSAYGYDDLGRLDSFKHAFDALPTGYTLDDAGNITVEGTKLYTYQNNRLKLRTELVGVFEYGYDLFGNQVTETELGKAPKTTEYNAASHTAKVTEPNGDWVEYVYDGMERLVSRRDSEGEVSLFFRDGLSEQIAVETDEQGNVTTRYLTDAYFVPRGKIDIGNSTGRSYYMTDPRGNVTQMLERNTGDIKAAFNYGPYGEDKGTDTVGNWDSRLKFQMAPKDPMTGSYTIGPRVMDPGINRFVGADMYVGAAANLGLQLDPLTGNRYLYAGANPIGMIDDGHRCQKISSFWTWGNCEDDTNAFLSGAKDVGKEAVQFAPGYDCVQMMRDPSWSGAGWCAVDFVPVVGKADNVAKLGKLGLKKFNKVPAACRANSFVPGTEVLMADGSTQPIEDVEVGDMVWAADPETGEQGPRQVTDLIVGDGQKDLVDIEIDGATITATDGHPFWVDDQGAWIDAEDLAPGDLLVLADGTTIDVNSVAERTGVLAVHNLTVDGIHTYHVMAGDNPVLVHNCTGPRRASKRPEKPTSPPSWVTQGGHYAETTDLNPAGAARRILNEEYGPGGWTGRGGGSEFSQLQKWLSRYFQWQ